MYIRLNCIDSVSRIRLERSAQATTFVLSNRTAGEANGPRRQHDGAEFKVTDPGLESPMSTAGKVLAVLVLITTLVWIILSAGVAQLNSNGNKRLHDLTQEVEKLQETIKQTQDDIVSLRTQTSAVEESADREFIVLRAKQSDIEKARSQILDIRARVEYQLAILQDTIEKAKTALQNRNLEQQSEEQVLAQARSEVKDLMDQSGALMSQLGSLRKDFQTIYHTNVESLGKTR
jgi:peptidoglycan hydrolase CwlO-like protein